MPMTNDEVDRYLAEKLMGWIVEPNRITEITIITLIFNRVPHYFNEDKIVMQVEHWQPTCNISQALGNGGPETVVGEMKALGWDFCYISLPREETSQFYCSFEKGIRSSIEKTGPRYHASADCSAEAISRAAVAALMV